MTDVLRRWRRELRALGARPQKEALAELLRAPSLPEQAVGYARLRREEGVSTADVVRELGALARVVGADPRLLEAMARVAGDPPPQPSPAEALALLSEGLVVLDAGGAVTLASGPQPAPPELARRALSTGRPQRARLQKDDRLFETEARPLERQRGAAQVFRDRSEVTRLERELQRADRELGTLQARLARSGHLQALADVAAGAALALNNELNAVALGLPLLLAARDDAERRRRLQSVEAAVRRAAEMVDRVQQLAAPRQGTAPRALDLNRLLVEALDLVRPDLTSGPSGAPGGQRVRVDARLGALPPLRARASPLRELLSGLLVQARDALAGGGLLVVRTHALDDGGELELRYAAPEAEQQLLGELALEGARGLAAAAGAELSAQREGGEQVVRVRLPPARERPPAPAAAPRPRRLLVVDDDADNRETLADLLAMLGHDVTAVGGGREALAALSAHHFDAALVDFAMPEMNGLELARRLRLAAPGLRLALVTGWEETAPAPGEVEAVFRKPLDLPALAAFLGDQA